nr:immunoglobulin heavy chain junction region [Macaca mulatta]
CARRAMAYSDDWGHFDYW